MDRKRAGLLGGDRSPLGRQLERANRSLLRAVKTLATVRKLMQPAMQVNIADKQINVVTPPAYT